MNTANKFFKENLIKNNIKRYNLKPISIAKYSPYTYFKNILYISGQLPFINGVLEYSGKIGRDLDERDSENCVLICTSNLLWNINDFLENTDKTVKNVGCLNLKGYFNTVENYKEHSILLDKASVIMHQVLGSEYGDHSRLAIGCNSLPKDSPVEIEAIFSIL